MSLGLRERHRVRPELPLVPLIDVLVMLVFFAFATMQFRSAAALNLTLPKVETAGKNALVDAITITINVKGETLFNGQPVPEGGLERLVQTQANIDKDITVMLRMDEETPVRLMTEAMDICRKHGLNKIWLQSRQ